MTSAFDLSRFLAKRFLKAAPKTLQRWMPDEAYLTLVYKVQTGRTLRLNPAVTFNEKLQWLKLHDRNPFYAQLVDKYEVRKYIAEAIGDEYLIPLFGVYEQVSEIDFASLPQQFVLKCTHDSGSIIICRDKSTFDIDAAIQKLSKCLKRNYYWHSREWCYKNVRPRIVCEQYMVDESGAEPKDYKLFCFNGQPKVIQVDCNRFTGHLRNLYDLEWNYMPVRMQYPTDPALKIEKPKKLATLLALAHRLAKDYPQVRIDFYMWEFHNSR